MPGGANGFDNGGVASNLVWLGPVRLLATHPPDHLATEHTGQIPHTPRTPHAEGRASQPTTAMAFLCFVLLFCVLCCVGCVALVVLRCLLAGYSEGNQRYSAVAQDDPPSMQGEAAYSPRTSWLVDDPALDPVLEPVAARPGQWHLRVVGPVRPIALGRSHLADPTWRELGPARPIPTPPSGMQRPDMRSIGCGSWAGVAAVH